MGGQVYAECASCGALVVDRAAHALYHARIADIVPLTTLPVTTLDPVTGDPVPADRPPVELDEVANAEILFERARLALAIDNDYLALGSPTTAQAIAQVRALTQQARALIRLAVRALDTTD